MKLRQYQYGGSIFAMVAILLSLGMVSMVWGQEGEAKLVRPYETYDKFEPHNRVDELVMAGLKREGLAPANLCSDEVFIRRVYLDLIGQLPEPKDIQRFMSENRPNKRADLIDSLMKRDEFGDYWALKWCDILRVKAEFPINLWPNAVQAYHRWILESIRDNKPYDQFARELLTSSGSNFRVPPVNFYRALQGQEPSSIASAVALTLMGTRLDGWPAEKRAGLEAFFSRVAFKKTAEWKEEIVYLDPAAMEALKAVFPDGKAVTIEPGVDPRVVFADWLIQPENPWFARNIVNRVWSWLMGYGIIHEPDDIREDNPPVNPELLAWLEKELVTSKYDLRHIYQLILKSRTYQQSSIPNGDPVKTARNFGCYPVRQLDAEVLIDALCKISGTKESYESPIPEPFTFIPEENRSIELADGSITSQFLEMFGRPSRDTGLESERDNKPTEAQRMHMLNSSHVQQKVESSWRVKALIKSAKGNKNDLVQSLYLNILSRKPTQEEAEVAAAYYNTKGISFTQATVDLAWALVNSKEFLFRH